ncbi:phosphoribosylformylglycinamidine cyclo-ligase [Mycoplasmatota bacterium WC30]
MSNKYQESGVSLERGYETVSRIKEHVKKTNNLGAMANIGAFGGMFDLSKYNVKEPVLVSGTDGVGTKLLIAQEANIHNTIGIDLVAMCVNDVITVLAEPLYFLDYIATGKLNPVVVEEIIKGISEGCIQAGCALVGGETAEMPDMYVGNHYDLAGYTTGVVEKKLIPDLSKVKAGDVLLGLKSSGLHSNGFSLVRKILFKDNNLKLDDYIEELGKPLKTELLTPTTIYVKAIEAIKNEVDIHGVSHITGGGFIENIPRMLPDKLGAKIEEHAIEILPIFKYLERLGKIPHQEMFNIFNMGIGMVIALSESDALLAMTILSKAGFKSNIIGKVIKQTGLKII